MPALPLTGVRVLDFGWHIAGPYAGRLLADYGAEVIKVERPGAGDPARRIGPFPPRAENPEQSGTFLWLNTNKRGMTLNLKSAEGREAALRLAAQADVIIESFRPGVMDRLGLGLADLRRVNPGVILMSISSFGQTGPYRDFRSTDLTLWAMGEIPYSTGNTDLPPLKTAGVQTSLHAGTNGVVGALAALWDREATGEGAHIDVSALESIVAHIEFALGMYECLGVVQRRRRATVGGFHPAGRTAAGQGELFLMFGSRSGRDVAVSLGIPGLDDPRFDTNALRYQNREAFDEVFLPWLKGHTASEAFSELQNKARLPVAKIMTLKELFEDEQYQARGFFVDVEHPEAGILRYPAPPFRMSRTPASIRRPAPTLGQHTADVLSEAGYSSLAIEAMRKSGAI